jgi:hypothetical protein
MHSKELFFISLPVRPCFHKSRIIFIGFHQARKVKNGPIQ